MKRAETIHAENGYEWRVESRRSYPGATYTWIEARLPEGEWVLIGDPWPKRNPPVQEIREAATLKLLGL